MIEYKKKNIFKFNRKNDRSVQKTFYQKFLNFLMRKGKKDRYTKFFYKLLRLYKKRILSVYFWRETQFKLKLPKKNNSLTFCRFIESVLDKIIFELELKFRKFKKKEILIPIPVSPWRGVRLGINVLLNNTKLRVEKTQVKKTKFLQNLLDELWETHNGLSLTCKHVTEFSENVLEHSENYRSTRLFPIRASKRIIFPKLFKDISSSKTKSSDEIKKNPLEDSENNVFLKISKRFFLMPREDYNLLNKDIYSSNKLISFERFHLIRRTQKKSIYFRPSKTSTYEEFNMFWVRKNRLPNMLNVFWAHKSKSRLPKMYKKHNLARKIRARYVRARKRILKWAKRWKWGSDSISKNGSYCRNLKDVIWFKKKKSKVSNVKLPKKKKKLLNKLKISKVFFNSYFKSYMKHFLTKCFRPAPDFAIHLKKFLNRILSLKSRLFKMIHYLRFEINKLEGKRIKIVEERQRKIVEKMHIKILEINLKRIFHETFKRDLDNFKRVYKIYGIITLKEHSGNLKILNLIIDQSTLNKKTRNKKTLEDITKEVSDILINIFKNKPKWTKKKYKNKPKWTKKKYKNKQKWTKKNIKTNKNGLKKNIKTNKKNVFKAKRLLI